MAWIKADTKAILAIHDHVITNNLKIRVTQNDRTTWTLKIDGVTEKDEGYYMCQINSEPMLSEVIIVVYEAVFILYISHPILSMLLWRH